MENGCQLEGKVYCTFEEIIAQQLREHEYDDGSAEDQGWFECVIENAIRRATGNNRTVVIVDEFPDD